MTECQENDKSLTTESMEARKKQDNKTFRPFPRSGDKQASYYSFP